MKKIVLLLGATALLAAGYSAFSQAPSEIIGCVYNSTLPTLANRQTTTLQCDSAGQLILAP